MSARGYSSILPTFGVRQMIVLAAVLVASFASAEERIALVVGNSLYESAPPLANPTRDAELISDTLKQLDFEVVRVTDTDRRTMAKAIQEFGGRLRQAGPDAVGLFFYAGHGVQAAGRNFLIPVDARVESEADLELESLTLDSVIEQMRHSGNATNIIILDACRNNPYRSNVRSSTRGLARARADGGTLIAFSAAPGEVAQDGTGDNSPYSKALSAAMLTSGATIEQAFKQVLVEVETETSGRQIPWVQSSLRGDFFFSPAETSPPATPETPATAEAPTPAPTAPRDETLEIPFWNTVRESDNPAEIQAFLTRFPDGVFASAARSLLASLEEGTADAETDATDAPTPATEPVLEGRDLARAMQTRLNELNCSAGVADGIWGRRSRSALQRFLSATNRTIDDDAPSMALLNLLKGSTVSCPAAVVATPAPAASSRQSTSGTTSLNGTWSYTATCPTGVWKGKLAVSGSGGTWVGNTSGLTGSIVSASASGGSARIVVSYSDFLGRATTETWTGTLSGRSLNGSISGGNARGCTFTASK